MHLCVCYCCLQWPAWTPKKGMIKTNELITVSGVTGYIDENGTAWLNTENVARGLGFTTVATSGNECVRWNTVYNYLDDLGVAESCNDSEIANY